MKCQKIWKYDVYNDNIVMKGMEQRFKENKKKLCLDNFATKF